METISYSLKAIFVGLCLGVWQYEHGMTTTSVHVALFDRQSVMSIYGSHLLLTAEIILSSYCPRYTVFTHSEWDKRLRPIHTGLPQRANKKRNLVLVFVARCAEAVFKAITNVKFGSFRVSLVIQRGHGWFGKYALALLW